MIEIKSNHIDGKRYCALILDKLLPAIKEKCPIAMLHIKGFINMKMCHLTKLFDLVAKSLELGINVAI